MSSQPDPPRKRSTTVTLVLVAGAGATALALGRCDPSQREEDVLVYLNPDACIAGGIRTEPECRSAYAGARAAYPEAAPRYESEAGCEAHHGAGHCLTGSVVAESATGRFVPILAGYVIGRRAEQDLDPQPVYDHAPNPSSAAYSGSGGGYCTSWGGRIVTAHGGASSSARVSSAAVRTASFGGFGGTGRGFSAHGGSGHGSGG
ncbi:DUF1190 domain-containing protein [uncultured Methylobacterium sp.]|uniref:DUF1190 domain-containing protein n=1 Tax=uncultured Methylobacterium sp. TaxID=157278 RepID=UPI0035CAEA85